MEDMPIDIEIELEDFETQKEEAGKEL